MRIFVAIGISLCMLASGAQSQTSRDQETIRITRNGTQPPQPAPADHFTGSARVDSSFQASAPARISGARVLFEPGSRTAWHAHPLGQTLIVTAGCGLVQLWGSPVEEIRPGDVVWIAPGEKHWHGATATTAMSHIAIVEQLDGKSADWMEKVSDEQCRAGSRAE